jgi:hypothetical protein
MPKTEEIVINASPTVALVAALGDLQVLQMYRRVFVPLEVCEEIAAGGATLFARDEFDFSMRSAIERMRARGIWLGEQVVRFALAKSGEA